MITQFIEWNGKPTSMLQLTAMPEKLIDLASAWFVDKGWDREELKPDYQRGDSARS